MQRPPPTRPGHTPPRNPFIARTLLGALAVSVFFLGSGFSGSSIDTWRRDDTLVKEPLSAPPGVFTNFNPRNIPELQQGRSLTETAANDLPPLPTDGRGDALYGSHRVPFFPASTVRPPETGTSLSVIDRLPPGYTDLNEREDQLVFISNLYTDTSFYANTVDKAKYNSSLDRGTFYEQNLRYELFTTRHNGDSLSLVADTTHTNDKRAYRDGFTLNQLTLESRTPRSLLAFGHSYPEFSNYSMTQQVMGFYGVQKFDNTEVRGFTGYRAVEKDDLKNPRFIGGVRVEHSSDESAVIGLNAVTTKDVHESPGSDRDLPTMANRVYSFDVGLRPTENIYVSGEYAGSNTDYDRRDEMGNQKGEAYRASASYGRENYKVEAGVEAGDTDFLSAIGEGPRDERAYYGRVFYELNRYVSTRFGSRSSRDNLANYKRATLVRDQPEFQITLKPSDYYRDLRVDLFFQPLREYSDNGNFVDRYRDLLWMELNHKAGALRYFAALSSTIDKDKITNANDRDISKYDVRLTWEYDAMRQLYGLASREQLNYKRLGGSDVTQVYGLGGRSQFHEDVSMNLDYTHERLDPGRSATDSTHDRVNLALTKEYNNMARLILSFEGSNNTFGTAGLEYADYSARLRYLRSF
ncbi:MAG TPA: hypothetical protein VIV61_03720 [Candidatus Ozemobacteraceae bacterium]